jgi:hypothetical protein
VDSPLKKTEIMMILRSKIETSSYSRWCKEGWFSQVMEDTKKREDNSKEISRQRKSKSCRMWHCRWVSSSQHFKAVRSYSLDDPVLISHKAWIFNKTEKRMSNFEKKTVSNQKMVVTFWPSTCLKHKWCQNMTTSTNHHKVYSQHTSLSSPFITNHHK